MTWVDGIDESFQNGPSSSPVESSSCASGSGRVGSAARKIADQLFDCGTSIGANAAEAEGAQTKPTSSPSWPSRERRVAETVYWLKLAIATSVTTKDEVAWELDEAQQLKAMITAAIKNGSEFTLARRPVEPCRPICP